MRAILKDGVLVLVPENDGETRDAGAFVAAHRNHVFVLEPDHDVAVVMHDLGPRDEACREPINITSAATDPAHALIGNFAATPFVLDGLAYASVEGFWQSLRFERESERRRVAAMIGGAAKSAGESSPWGATFVYGGATLPVGRPEHWQLMERACEAKFAQNEAARRALLDTGTRPLTHRVRRDSRTIPGVVMAEIWMRVRERLRAASTPTPG